MFFSNGQRRIVSGNDRFTTNNRMELMAAVKGLEAAPANPEVVIYSDSRYLVNTMTRGWNRNANRDLWQKLDQLVEDRHIIWRWVRGGQGTPGNEIADRVASMEAQMFDTRDPNRSRKGSGPVPGNPRKQHRPSNNQSRSGPRRTRRNRA